MTNKLMELEKQILQNRYYLNRYYNNTEMLLSQVDMILNVGMPREKIQRWLRTNKIAIKIVIDILKKKNEKIC
ncbi:hypothetical protein [Sulfurimonas autotrophica]|nr:hypothetical protein [Sulfurimonas autotrophica]